MFPSRIVDNVVKHYLNKRFVPIETFDTTRQGQISAHHCKLPFIGLFSNNVQRNIRRITIIGKGAFPWSVQKRICRHGFLGFVLFSGTPNPKKGFTTPLTPKTQDVTLL